MTIIAAGASNVASQGFMSRHPKSPGMTSFHSDLDVFPLEKVDFSHVMEEGTNENRKVGAEEEEDVDVDIDEEGEETRKESQSGGVEESSGSSTDGIQLVRVQDILEAKGVPEGRSSQLRLLKLDAEGFELKALQGLNMTRYPFQYFTFEFFPAMLRQDDTDPVDLLVLVREAGYHCDKDGQIGSTREEMNEWVGGITDNQHVNMYCEHKG